MMSRILLTGFEPFGGEKVNPSELAVKQLEGKTIAGLEVVAGVYQWSQLNVLTRR